MKDIIILGAGGFAREVAWLIEQINEQKNEWNLLGFIDENEQNHGKVINGYKVLGDFDVLDKIDRVYCVCAVGNPVARKKMTKNAKEKGAYFATLIHPRVEKSSLVRIGEGSMICAGNIITTNIKIGQHVIVNVGCTVGHDAVLEDYVTVLPNSSVSGNVRIKEGCNIGTMTAIINDVSIGEWTIIGAGATVAKDLPAYCTAVGVPAKPIKFHKEL